MGNRQRTLGGTGFIILPGTPDGFEATADPRLARRVLDEAAKLQPPRYPDLLSEDEQLWIAANEPSEEFHRPAFEALRAYLGETGFGWLAACAVYPEVKASLTLFLGNQIASPYQPSILERLARLPWMRQAYIPDWLRRILLRELGGRRERVVRGSLRGLLLSTGHVHSSLSFEIARSSLKNLADLGADVKPAGPRS